MKSEFLTPLIFRDDKGLPYTLEEDLLYRSELLGKLIVVPRGFQTDLASIPRGLWNILPKSGGYDKGAVIHDYLYKFNGVSRKEADEVLREASEVEGVGAFTRNAIYWGCRLGGGSPWKKYRDVESVR